MCKAFIIRTLIVVAAIFVGAAAFAWDQDPIQDYLQRSNTVTLGAGDDQSANVAIQAIDPWPQHVGNRRIPGNGERMSGAIERYRDVSKLPLAPPPLSPIFDSQNGTGSGAASK